MKKLVSNTTAPVTMTVTRKIAVLGLLGALSLVLVFFRVPFIPAPYLEYDLADVPILLATLYFGPITGLVLTVVVSVIQGVTISAGGGWYGILMHIIATGVLCLVVGNLYRLFGKRKGGLIASLALGSFSMALVMAGANLIITPLFLGKGISEVLPMLLPIIIPFNVLKAGLNSILAFFVLKAVKRTAIGKELDNTKW